MNRNQFYLRAVTCVFFAGTILPVGLLRVGIGTDFKYEMSVFGLVSAGYIHLGAMAFQYWMNNPGKLRHFFGKLIVLVAIANFVDMLAIWNGAWNFPGGGMYQVRLGFLRTLSGGIVELPLAEMFGFNLAIIGAILYLVKLVDLKNIQK